MDVILKAKSVLDNFVILPTTSRVFTILASKKHLGKHYKWACCECMFTTKENMYKHQRKMQQILHPFVAEGTIMKCGGTLKGTIQSKVISIPLLRQLPTCYKEVQRPIIWTLVLRACVLSQPPHNHQFHACTIHETLLHFPCGHGRGSVVMACQEAHGGRAWGQEAKPIMVTNYMSRV